MVGVIHLTFKVTSVPHPGVGRGICVRKVRGNKFSIVPTVRGKCRGYDCITVTLFDRRRKGGNDSQLVSTVHVLWMERHDPRYSPRKGVVVTNDCKIA